jgi:hypothetical protein
VAEINTWIHKVLNLGVDSYLGAGLAPLREWATSTRVSMFGPVSAAYMILSFYCACDHAQGLWGTRSKLWDAHLLKDASR